MFSKKQTSAHNTPPGRMPARRTPMAGQNRTFSYYANRSQSELNVGREAVQSKPPLRRLPGKLQKLRRHFGWLLVGVLAVGLVAYQLQLSSTPKVVALTKTSDAPFLRDSTEYQRQAAQIMANSAANRNKLTVNTGQVAQAMKKAFPELDDVSVSLPLVGDQATIYVRPAEPALVLATNSGNYVLDQNGRALAMAGGTTGSAAVPSVTDRSNLTVTLGKQALPRSATQFIQTIVAQMQTKQIKVQSLTLPAATSELDAYITGVPYFVKFNIHDSSQEAARVQVGTFLALRQQLAGQRITPAQYVDVRIEGRAYYK